MSGGRILAIGDIHGCARTFRRLLEKVELVRSDTLYLLGDLIDRGPDSRSLIEMILKLQNEAFDIRGCKGNHEDMLLEAVQSGVFESLMEWLENGGVQTVNSYGVDYPQDLPEEHLQFLEHLPLVQVSNDFVFAHSGIMSMNDLHTVAGRRYILWDRSGVVNVAMLGGRRVVSGHTPRKLADIKKSLTEDHVQIDNGVYMLKSPGFGNLICVDLGTNELFIQPNIDMAPADH